MVWKSIRYSIKRVSLKTVQKSIQHSLDSNQTSNEHSNAKNLCLNEIQFHESHTV